MGAELKISNQISYIESILAISSAAILREIVKSLKELEKINENTYED
jgi:hypothetical protein